MCVANYEETVFQTVLTHVISEGCRVCIEFATGSSIV